MPYQGRIIRDFEGAEKRRLRPDDLGRDAMTMTAILSGIRHPTSFGNRKGLRPAEEALSSYVENSNGVSRHEAGPVG